MITIPLWLFILICIPAGIAALTIGATVLMYICLLCSNIWKYIREEIRQHRAMKRRIVEENIDDD